MATGRKTVVVGQVIDPDVWGNPLWDQSVQTFASAADRTAQFPTPKQGAVTYLEDVHQFHGWDGVAWVRLHLDRVTVDANASLVGNVYAGQPIRHRYANVLATTSPAGDYILMTVADYAGGGILHCSVYSRSQPTPVIIVPYSSAGNLVLRILRLDGSVLASGSVNISARIDYWTALVTRTESGEPETKPVPE